MNANQRRSWYIVSYKVPSNPSTARVTIWRKTRELGALLLQQPVYILPVSPQLRDAVGQLKVEIQQFGGECQVLEMASLAADQEKELTAGFNRLRNQEYEEVIEEAQALLHEVARESRAGKFHFAELEEVEGRLEKLREWFKTVTQRDFFGADLRAEATRIMEECGEGFETFSHEVFSREGSAVRDGKTGGSALARGRAGKQKERQVYSKDELIIRLKEVVTALEDGTLEVGEKRVANVPESAALELKYEDRQGRKRLEMEVGW
ncbi:MAG: amphi-Trp domain-containing protein [Chloroflexi bacterium]|nr:amphi-Trp domain-containing protein [Chloroflexota bacterium]